MASYKKKIKLRMALLLLLALVAGAFAVYNMLLLDAETSESVQTVFHVVSFQCGATLAIAVLSFAKAIQYFFIMKDDKKITLEYNRENDERTKTIRSKAGVPLITITSGITILAGIIAGYYNSAVFIALIAAALFQNMVSIGVKLYYKSKL